ncbi:phage tail protein [Erythrobacter arachoides]|uniref:Phage tail protein n=1 Tax=Aurantiacibacter arachoides TaxID=1850444 RepID=A0A844ZYT1_9SPHN|nr:tail fiber protein [Aurantiacibacter arachoides]MXO92868.1 phage tail protein [Aurantiacibacter arachoides]GGD53835.1 tail Collar domain-containing protein [Aurantiacibacter arachoides]
MKFLGYLSTTAAVTAIALASTSPARAQAEPTIGQLVLVPYNFCPRGFARADGQLIPIAQNTALFSLYGTMYGGNGQTTFALPDLRGRTAINQGQGPGLSVYQQGQSSGVETVTLTQATIPSHNHTGSVRAFEAEGTSGQAVRNYFAQGAAGRATYVQVDAPPQNNMGPGSLRLADAGGNQAHENRSPYTTLNWCVAVNGIFPSRN